MSKNKTEDLAINKSDKTKIKLLNKAINLFDKEEKNKKILRKVTTTKYGCDNIIISRILELLKTPCKIKKKEDRKLSLNNFSKKDEFSKILLFILPKCAYASGLIKIGSSNR